MELLLLKVNTSTNDYHGQQRSNVVDYFLVNIENKRGEWYNEV